MRQIARENIKIHDKQLNKEQLKKMINPYYFPQRATQIGFNIALDSHHINHASSMLTNKSKFFKIETRYVNKKLLSVFFFC